MPPSSQTVEASFAEIMEKRPVLRPILTAFAAPFTARAELAAAMAAEDDGPRLPKARPERLGQGAAILAGESFGGLGRYLDRSAESLLPLLERLQAMAPHGKALRAFFLPANPAEDDRELLLGALVAGDTASETRIAEKHDIDAPVLDFAAGFVISAVLRAMTRRAMAGEDESIWDQNDIWRLGTCPVCGALPSVAWLDRPKLDEKNAYLVGGGGAKHLHCGQCGADWKFRRGACPSCGKEGSGAIETLYEEGIAHSERLDWCTSCKGYCPVIDLRERETVPDMDAAAMGMMHLDMVAARKKLRPLRPSFWNMF